MFSEYKYFLVSNLVHMLKYHPNSTTLSFEFSERTYGSFMFQPDADGDKKAATKLLIVRRRKSLGELFRYLTLIGRSY